MDATTSSSHAYIANLIDKYGDMIYRLSLTYLRNRQDAQDVCQDVYIKLFRHMRSFNDDEHEKAWVIRVTINTCKDAIRSPWKRWFLPVSDDLYSITSNDQFDVVSFVLTLPRKYRLVIHLYYFEGYQGNEIAEILNLNEGTVRTQLKRAKELLKTKMLGGME
ncbi:RNA polymerase, sigma-24 subunit, ECF subfamily [Paenibacillus curdlanolyticus YK9]|uniref:RNA polymerase, sigma-24 subunit, ECF subfamily n=1 Tax=Paenibacillus curdlanolyticus YK9 TaxID=717606 RepID=E0IDJ0_9BACL|nr:sigma-70 family RNA polymerase sigma factor [Paenibacillus curdlanolyticus]EFM09645.1 RNA polymerase, sigma-24 subunit, ECF subfamily [Paenibacillus curdlanolyticus YK9]